MMRPRSTRAPVTRGCGSWQSTPLSPLPPLPSRTGPKHAPPDVQASPRLLRRARSRMDVPAVRVRYGVRRGRRGVLLPPRGASLLAYSRSFYLHARLSMGLYVGRLIDPRAAARAVHAAAPVRGDVGQPNLSLVLERGPSATPALVLAPPKISCAKPINSYCNNIYYTNPKTHDCFLVGCSRLRDAEVCLCMQSTRRCTALRMTRKACGCVAISAGREWFDVA